MKPDWEWELHQPDDAGLDLSELAEMDATYATWHEELERAFWRWEWIQRVLEDGK
mgnify:CR=1 FL=1